MLNTWLLIAIGVVLMPIISQYAKSIDDEIDKIDESDTNSQKLIKLKAKSKKIQRLALLFFLIIAAALAFITRSMLPPL